MKQKLFERELNILSHDLALMSFTAIAYEAMRREPTMPANVPSTDTAPSVPRGTGFNDVIRKHRYLRHGRKALMVSKKMRMKELWLPVCFSDLARKGVREFCCN